MGRIAEGANTNAGGEAARGEVRVAVRGLPLLLPAALVLPAAPVFLAVRCGRAAEPPPRPAPVVTVAAQPSAGVPEVALQAAPPIACVGDYPGHRRREGRVGVRPRHEGAGGAVVLRRRRR